jgi:hypothetical protein
VPDVTPSESRKHEAAKPVRIRLRDFKTNARRILPSGHPLLRVLSTVPDELNAADLRVMLPGWLVLLEE